MAQGAAVDLKDLFLKGTESIVPPSVTPKPTIKKLNFSHEAIIQWLLENPGKVDGGKLKACADHFGYTQAWLSIIIHSDAFKAKWRDMQDEADQLILNDIPTKLRGTASLAIDGLAAQIETAVADQTVAPRDFLLKSSEMLLKSLGYGQGGKVVINQGEGSVTNVAVGAEALSRARGKLEAVSRAPSAQNEEPKLIGSGTTTPTTP